MASQITSLTIVYSTVYSGADQRKHQSSASLAFVRGIHRSLVNSPHKGPVTRKMFPFDDVIMFSWRCVFHYSYFPDIFKLNGQLASEQKYGDWFSYDKTPRALIFKREQGKITDMKSMMKVMR